MNTDFSFASEFSNEVVKERIPDPCLMVIFGASGDLTKRMLIPSLYELFLDDLLPENFTVVGFSRKEMDTDAFQEMLKEGIKEF